VTVYTTRFGAYAHDSFTGIAPLLTAPAGFVHVIRHIAIASKNFAATGRLEVGIQSTAGLLVLVSVPEAVAGSVHELDLRQVLEPGETLYAYSGIAPWSVVVTGYRFTATTVGRLPAPRD